MFFFALITLLLSASIAAPSFVFAAEVNDVCAARKAAGEQIIVCVNNTDSSVGLRYCSGPVMVMVYPKSKIIIPRICFTHVPAVDICNGIEKCELGAGGAWELASVGDAELAKIFEFYSFVSAYDRSCNSLVYCLVQNDTPYEIRIFTGSDDPIDDFQIASCGPGVRVAIPSKLLCQYLYFEVIKGDCVYRISPGWCCNAITCGRLTSGGWGRSASFKLIEAAVDEGRK